MKKGLRRVRRVVASNDEGVRTVDLMKKGLRRLCLAVITAGGGQNRRPDEEGIKTVSPAAVAFVHGSEP